MDHNRASTSGSDHMPEPAPMFRPQKPKELNEHIHQLYKPEHGEPSMEILFFHGLQFGHNIDPPYLSTWRTADTSKEVWPGTWLAEEFPQAHIFSISYDASMRTTREHGRLDLHNLAENLVQAIRWAGIGQGFGRPVIFVGHCFGGLAIKELLVQADHTHHSARPDSDRNQQIEKFLNNIGGVFFYGTPHHGSHLVDKAAYFLDGPLLHYVKSLSTESARLEQRFVSMRNKYKIYYIASVGELHETSWGLFHGLVVPEASARYGDFFCTVAADHISLCKPAKKTSNSFQHLICFIQSITPKVQGEACFQKIRPRVPKGAVGLDQGVQEIREKLQRKRSVGIVGMGGIGKTTLAREVLNKLGPTFEFTCFVSVVKEIAGTVKEVKKEMWEQMQCGGKNVANASGWSQLDGKKLLLVLDDAASNRDLEGWLDIVDDVAPTSRLVVTSRDKELLKNMDDLYLVPFLNKKGAKQLFTSYAFPSQLPPLPLEQHVDSIVKKCDGLPLTLEVLGKYLKGKEKGELWNQTLQALCNADNVVDFDERLWAKLRVSYLSLKEEEKQMFLDVTTFFSDGGWTLREAKAAWGVKYGLADLRWHTLVDRSLVYDGLEDKPIKVHEQLQSLGRKLASDGKCIRSWETMEGWNLLQATDLIDNQEIHSLRLSPIQDENYDYFQDRSFDELQVSKSGLSRLKELQYLDIRCLYKSHNYVRRSKPFELVIDQIASGCKPSTPWSLPETLSFRDLLEKMLPRQLVLLRSPTLQFGPILCEPILLSHLVVLKLDLPSDSHLSSSIGQLSMLKILKITATKLMELPDEIGELHQLERLTFDECICLETLPETFGHLSNLKNLQFDWCALQSLPESFGQLHTLEYLRVSSLYLHTLPQSIGQLSRLEVLELSCHCLDTLPDSFGQWPNLEKLCIWGGVKELPFFSLRYLNALRHVELVHTPLARIPDWVQYAPKLQILVLGFMDSLEGLPPWLRESLPAHVTLDMFRNWYWKFYRTQDGHFSCIQGTEFPYIFSGQVPMY